MVGKGRDVLDEEAEEKEEEIGSKKRKPLWRAQPRVNTMDIMGTKNGKRRGGGSIA